MEVDVMNMEVKVLEAMEMEVLEVEVIKTLEINLAKFMIINNIEVEVVVIMASNLLPQKMMHGIFSLNRQNSLYTPLMVILHSQITQTKR